MDKLYLTGVRLKGFKRTAKGGVATFACNLTAEVRKKLELDEVPASYDAASPGSQTVLAATRMHLKSDAGKLAGWEFTIDITTVDSVVVSRKKDGKGRKMVMEFAVHFQDLTGCAHLENYITNTGEDEKGTLEITYNKAPRQDSLPAAEGEKQPNLDVQ